MGWRILYVEIETLILEWEKGQSSKIKWETYITLSSHTLHSRAAVSNRI